MEEEMNVIEETKKVEEVPMDEVEPPKVEDEEEKKIQPKKRKYPKKKKKRVEGELKICWIVNFSLTFDEYSRHATTL